MFIDSRHSRNLDAHIRADYENGPHPSDVIYHRLTEKQRRRLMRWIGKSAHSFDITDDSVVWEGKGWLLESRINAGGIRIVTKHFSHWGGHRVSVYDAD